MYLDRGPSVSALNLDSTTAFQSMHSSPHNRVSFSRHLQQGLQTSISLERPESLKNLSSGKNSEDIEMTRKLAGEFNTNKQIRNAQPFETSSTKTRQRPMSQRVSTVAPPIETLHSILRVKE